MTIKASMRQYLYDLIEKEYGFDYNELKGGNSSKTERLLKRASKDLSKIITSELDKDILSLKKLTDKTEKKHRIDELKKFKKKITEDTLK